MTDQPARDRVNVGGCAVERTIRLLSGEWTTHILWKLSSIGPMRFGALRRELGTISAKVLTAKLRHLETVGLVRRYDAKTVPPEVTYELTAAGGEFDKLLKAFETFAVNWDDGAAPGDADPVDEPLAIGGPRLRATGR